MIMSDLKLKLMICYRVLFAKGIFAAFDSKIGNLRSDGLAGYSQCVFINCEIQEQQQSKEIDELERILADLRAEIFECENNPDFHGHSDPYFVKIHEDENTDFAEGSGNIAND